MNPIPIAAYLDARNKSRDKREETLRSMATQAMQQQLAMAQQGAELRDRGFQRDMQTKQFDQQKGLTDLQIAEAQRLAKIAPIKDKQTFLAPLLEPYNAYSAAQTAYNDYMKPGTVKFRPPSEVRTYADNLRKARASALAARTSLGRLGLSSGMEGITPESLEKDYPINDLPLMSSGVMGSQRPMEPQVDILKLPLSVGFSGTQPPAQTGFLSKPTPSNLPPTNRPQFTGQRFGRPNINNGMYPRTSFFRTDPNAFKLGGDGSGMAETGRMIGSNAPPPPPPDNEPATRSAAGEIPVPPRKYSGPPIQISPFKSSVLKFKSLLEPLRMAEGDLQYSDLYEPQQKLADADAAEMYADAMDSFVPRTYNRLATGRDHAEMNAADFAEYGLDPEHVSQLMARYVHGDSMGMKQVILERYLSMFSPYNMPSKLNEKFIKNAKDKADLDEAADRMLTTKQGRDINAKQEERAAAMGRVALATGKTELGIKQQTAKDTIALLKKNLENAGKEGQKADLQLDALKAAAAKGKIPNWGSVLGKANDFWSKMVDNRIGASIKLASAIIQGRLNTALEEGADGAQRDALMAAQNKLARLQGMLSGPSKAFMQAYNSNSPTLLTILSNHKRALYDIVKDDPSLKPFFINLGGTLDDGSPGNN